MSAHQDNPLWGAYAQKLQAGKGFEKPRKGADVGDHPPITPVKSATSEMLGDREWKLYEYIARNFLATISKSATFDARTVVFGIGGEEFKLRGKIMKDPGFLEVCPWLSVNDVKVGKYKVDDSFPVTCKIEERYVSFDQSLTSILQTVAPA